MDLPFDVCECGHPREEHLLGSRSCTGKFVREKASEAEKICLCVRFKLWYKQEEKSLTHGS